MKVIVFGTFDIIHPGHLSLFRQAKKRGDCLVAVVARDRTVIRVKGKRPLHNERERAENLRKIPAIDEVVLGNLKDKYAVLEKIRPDKIALGYDQESFTEKLKEELRKRKIKAEVIRLRPYRQHVYKSSKLR